AKEKAEAAKEKAAQEAKEKAAAEAKAKADAAAKAKADAAAKAKAAADAKKKAAAEAAKNSSDVDDLLGGLASGKNAPKSGAAGGGAAGQGNQKKAGASGAEINSYLGQVVGAIQSRFYDADTYKGKECNLRIKLAPDGLLIDVKSEGGDPALCQAAIAAAKQAHIPKPPSQAVYEVFKNAPMRFKPE
uniref:cell envelope integrity protein TolA n=1 Tax=Pantoea septica TaxID=472695 RepID=UPI000535278D